MDLTEWEERRLRAELARAEGRLAGATREEQGRILDEVLDRAGLDPTWAEWKRLAHAWLPAYRDRRGSA